MPKKDTIRDKGSGNSPAGTESCATIGNRDQGGSVKAKVKPKVKPKVKNERQDDVPTIVADTKVKMLAEQGVAVREQLSGNRDQGNAPAEPEVKNERQDDVPTKVKTEVKNERQDDVPTNDVPTVDVPTVDVPAKVKVKLLKYVGYLMPGTITIVDRDDALRLIENGRAVEVTQ